MADVREQYIASKAYKRPVGSFTQRDDIRDFARSGPGRNYFAMENLQSQAPRFAPDDPRIDELKQRRGTWNRYQKYPAGEILGKTPQQMQNEYMGLSRDLRQTAKPVYNKMYPLTGRFMDISEKGGLWGSLLSKLAGKTIKKTKDYMSGTGVASLFADETEAEKERYVTETFGPHREDIEELDFTDEYEGPWPHAEGEPSLVYEEPELTREEQIEQVLEDPGIRTDADFLLGLDDEPKDDISKYEDYIERGVQETLPFDEGREDFIRRQNEYVAPIPATLGTPDPQGDFARFNKYPTPDIGIEFGGDEPPALPPYEGREFGLGQFMKEMPTSRKSDWEDYLEYVQRLGDMEGGRLTYDEWHDMMRRKR